MQTKFLSQYFKSGEHLDLDRHVFVGDFNAGYIRGRDVVLIKHPDSKFAVDKRPVHKLLKRIAWHLPHRTRFKISDEDIATPDKKKPMDHFLGHLGLHKP